MNGQDSHFKGSIFLGGVYFHRPILRLGYACDFFFFEIGREKVTHSHSNQHIDLHSGHDILWIPSYIIQ